MKDMLSEKDIRRIGEEMGKVIDDNLMPRIEDLIDGKLAPLDTRLTRVESSMVTKDDLDDKLAPLKGKINVLVDVLHRNGTISDDHRRIVHS